MAGGVALLLQDEPNLTPDQVKYRLMSTANKNWAGYSSARAGAGYLDVLAAVSGTSTNGANTNLTGLSIAKDLACMPTRSYATPWLGNMGAFW